jgi:hypothetical protein
VGGGGGGGEGGEKKEKKQHPPPPPPHPALRRLLGPALCSALGVGGGSAPSASSCAKRPLLPDAPLPPFPAQAVCDALRRAQLAGWPDQVARRVRSAEHAARTAAGGQAGACSSSSAGRAVRYAPCSLADDVFLHPRSALRASAPDFVVYTGLVRTAKRCYMGGVAGVEAGWLASVGPPVCAVASAAAAGGAPGAAAPRYSARADAVVEMREASYGARGWLLQRVPRVPEGREDRAAAFAAALLGGGVVFGGGGGGGGVAPSSPFSLGALLAPKMLVAPAASAARPELRGLTRVGELVGALARAGVDTRAALAREWRLRPDFLRRELRLWVRPGPGADAFDRAWAEVVRRALARGEEERDKEEQEGKAAKRGRAEAAGVPEGKRKTKQAKKSG